MALFNVAKVVAKLLVQCTTHQDIRAIHQCFDPYLFCPIIRVNLSVSNVLILFLIIGARNACPNPANKALYASTPAQFCPPPHLINKLNTSRQGKFTLISAPAGFGKTTLISGWLQPDDEPVAWLSLDNGDNDTARFLTYVIASLRQIAPHIGEATQAVLQSPQAPQPLPLEAIITVLINEVTDLSDQFILVLDDYHVITAQPIHDILTFLLENLPPQMHFVITSRVDPPLPLPQLRVRGEMSEIRSADLRFSSKETAEYLNEQMGLALSTSEIEALTERTEGWVASLQLAALSLQGHTDKSAFVASFSGTNRYLVDYLIDEVLAQLPAEIQQFRRQTSPLERFCAEICDAVLQATNSQVILQRLERANLF